MNTNIEIEAKVLLNEKDYKAIIAHLSLDKYHKIKQKNHYIDSDALFLKHNGLALRIREKDDFILTLKTPLSEGLLEKNQVISWKEYEDFRDQNIFPEGEIKKFLEIIGVKIPTIRIQTSMQTERIELDYKGATLCLDKNTYGKNLDYELEMSHTSIAGAEDLITELLNSIGIKFTFNEISKQSRAIKALYDTKKSK